MPTRTPIFILMSIFALSDCSKDSSSDSSSANTETLELALEGATASESLTFADNTISTLDQGLEETAGSLVINLADQQTYASKWCSNHGDAMDEPNSSFTSLLNNFPAADDGTMNSKHPNFAARQFHCQLKVNSESPDTVRGAYSLVKGILCAVENSNGIDWENPGAKNVTIAFTDECFGPKMLKEMGDGTQVDLIVTSELLSDEKNWDKSVTLTNLKIGDEPVDDDTLYYFAFRNRKDGLAVKFYAEESSRADTYQGWSFALDTDGELRFEKKTYNQPDEALTDDEEDEDSYGSDFVRIYAKGSIVSKNDKDGNTTTKFESVDSFQGIYALVHPHPDSEGAGKDSATVLTIKGFSDVGFETRTYSCNNDGDQTTDGYSCNGDDASTYVNLSAESKKNGYRTCFPEESSCGGIAALEFAAGDEAVIMRVDSADDLEKNPWDWIKEMEKPLSFTEVTWDYIQE